jgi:hypothetical protein
MKDMKKSFMSTRSGKSK